MVTDSDYLEAHLPVFNFSQLKVAIKIILFYLKTVIINFELLYDNTVDPKSGTLLLLNVALSYATKLPTIPLFWCFMAANLLLLVARREKFQPMINIMSTVHT